jgi:hypothetical protein
MPLNEPTLSGATVVTAGQLYCVNGKPTVAPTTQTVSAWAAQIGGSPVISSCDVAGRQTDSPFRPGADIFGT